MNEMFNRYLYEAADMIYGGKIFPHWDLSDNIFWFEEKKENDILVLQYDFIKNEIKEIEKPKMKKKKPEENLKINQPRDNAWILGINTKEKISPDKSFFLGNENGNLYKREFNSENLIKLTNSGSKDLFWDSLFALISPSSLKIAILKIDTSEMRQEFKIQHEGNTFNPDFFTFAYPGDPIFSSEPFVLDLNNQKLTKISYEKKKDSYIKFLSWNHDESSLFFTQINRGLKNLAFYRYDIKTNASVILFTENQKNFINYDVFKESSTKFLPEFEQFFWISERNGKNQIYRYNYQGKLLNQVTSGEFFVLKISWIDRKNKIIFFQHRGASDKKYFDIHFSRIKFDGTNYKLLTEENGTHSIKWAPNHQYFLDTYSTISEPPITVVKTPFGKQKCTISAANIIKLKNELSWMPPKEFCVKSADNITDLNGVLFFPHNFDINKQYPIIEYIYGGNHGWDVPTTFDPSYFLNVFAQLGYITFIVDVRGTYGRKKSFQDTTYGKPSQIQIADHKTTLEQLSKRFSYIDSTRVGIFGISYGGYVVLQAISSMPNMYSVAIATSTSPSLKDMVWTYAERIADLLSNNPKGYEEENVLNKIEQIKTKLLLIHGLEDTNAPISGLYKLIHALNNNNKTYDLHLLPGEKHSFSQKGILNWLNTMKEYFLEYL